MIDVEEDVTEKEEDTMPYRFCVVLCMATFAAIGTGCGPTVEDFPKQEFVLQKEPLVHLALRGSRKGRKLVCQVFLLTTDPSMWVSGVDLKLRDGTYLDPKRFESLDDIDRDRYPDVWLGFGAGYGRGYPYYRDYPYYRRYWYHGPFSCYRTGAGVCIPAWYLLGRSRGNHTPAGLGYTYELSAGQETCTGTELIVHVALKPEEKKAGKPAAPASDKGVVKDEAAAVTRKEKNIRFPFAFSLSEKASANDVAKEESSQIIYEIRFAPVGKKSPR